MAKEHAGEMAFEVDDEILAKAHMCEKGFSCLRGKTAELCPVDRFIEREGREAVFVKCESAEHCNYRIPFGLCGHGCTCPVRVDIFRRYGK